MNDMDIFIFTHTDDFKICPKNDVYKIISSKRFDERSHNLEYFFTDNGNNINNFEHSYSEGSMMYWIWKNYSMKKYVGTSQYRKYFDFFDNIPDIDSIFNEHDGIIRTPISFGCSIIKQYDVCHNINDFVAVINILFKKYPQYATDIQKVISSNVFYPCNMFILRKETFCEMCQFVFDVLDEFNKVNSFTCDNDVKNYCKKNESIYTSKQDSSLESQSRIHGFLIERLVTIFLMLKLKNPFYINAFELPRL